MVFTFVYFGFDGEDISFFKFLAAAAASVGASVRLVQLRCSEETLLNRVSNASCDESKAPPQKLAHVWKHSSRDKSAICPATNGMQSIPRYRRLHS